jgi:fumarylpyruvate hydrolase
MSQYAVPSPLQTSVAIAGDSLRFPVRRIYCVGRNYADHAREMGFDPRSEPPFFFAKPADAIVESGGEVPFPPRTEDFHHEVELVVALGAGGLRVPVERAQDLVFGYAVGNDFTRRDQQAAARESGRPWDIAKGLDCGAGIGPIHCVAGKGHPRRAALWLTVNGERRQSGDIADLIWSVPEIIAELSTYFELSAGDLIYTGTPAGVGPLAVGDRVVAGIEGLGEIEHRIGAPR